MNSTVETISLQPQFQYTKPSTTPRIWFISFGTSNYDSAKQRIFSQAKDIPIFTDIAIYNEDSLKQHPIFWPTHSKFIESSPRGYGYWLWKPFVIYETLKHCNENDIVIYADAGCVLNPNGLPRLNEYISMVQSYDLGALGFQLNNNFTESQFTKMSLIKHMNAEQYLNTKQIIGGINVFRKCIQSINIVNKWYELASIYKYIDDSPSDIPNSPDFRDHRHDQSIFSILAKQHGIKYLQDETDGTHSDYPIWAIRQRNS